jgi:polyphosphate kinase
MLKHDFLPTLPSLLGQSSIPLIHRDLSWLQFNDRVLAEALQPSNPLLERAKFLAISASNLDEFFMIRFSSLGRAIQNAEKADGTRSDLARKLERVRDNILEAAAQFGARQHEALEILAAELEHEGIRIIRHAVPEDPAFALSRRLFEDQVLTRLTPPEGFTTSKLSQLENLQMGVVFKGGIWFKIPKHLPAVLSAQEGGVAHFFFLDDLLSAHLGEAFRLEGPAGFLKLTRDGDFTVDLEEEDTESIPDVVRTGLGSREKGRPVRLQYWGEVPGESLENALQALKFTPGQLLPAPGTLCLPGLWTVVNQTPEEISSRPGLKYPSRHSTAPAALRGEHGTPDGMFARVRAQDVLLHHPYDSFDGFVNWISAACKDPGVTRIEQTVYRMDALSPVLEALKAAARTKKIRVIIELRARFDELNNLALAEELRRAGVEVAFGFGKLKLHAKIALVTRAETGPDGSAIERLYTHLSTGNYNAYTARQYTDLAILTANPEIGADGRQFFDAVWKGEVPAGFKVLVPAPTRLHRLLVSHIQAETQAAREGRRARIVAKVNALVDEAVIEHLYQASRAGVQVDLIVRGACALIPGVKGLSENIRVISVVDRFLEHSRIYLFQDSRKLYLSSADWMPRNFFSRLEIAFPVVDPGLYRYLVEVVIPAYLSDTVKARELTPQGTWRKRTLSSVRLYRPPGSEGLFGKKPVRSQFLFQELAANGYAGTPLEAKG